MSAQPARMSGTVGVARTGQLREGGDEGVWRRWEDHDVPKARPRQRHVQEPRVGRVRLPLAAEPVGVAVDEDDDIGLASLRLVKVHELNELADRAVSIEDGLCTLVGHSNRSVAELSASLFAMGLDHILVGLPEAFGEALAGMEAACQFGAGHVGFNQVRLRLAVFLTASARGNRVPEVALGLAGSTALRPKLVERLEVAQLTLQHAAANGVEQLVNAAMNLWPSLGITAANRPWDQAARTFGALARQAQRRAGGSSTFFNELARTVPMTPAVTVPTKTSNHSGVMTLAHHTGED